MGLVTMGALMGGNVRVGLEDSIYLAKGQLAKSNAEQVAKIRRILEDLSLEIATPAEARKMLSLKGSAVASDAFFPFPDGLIAAAEAGATCAIQPGGSVRDEEVIAAANERKMAMLVTGVRHFRH